MDCWLISARRHTSQYTHGRTFHLILQVNHSPIAAWISLSVFVYIIVYVLVFVSPSGPIVRSDAARHVKLFLIVHLVFNRYFHLQHQHLRFVYHIYESQRTVSSSTYKVIDLLFDTLLADRFHRPCVPLGTLIFNCESLL